MGGNCRCWVVAENWASGSHSIFRGDAAEWVWWTQRLQLEFHAQQILWSLWRRHVCVTRERKTFLKLFQKLFQKHKFRQAVFCVMEDSNECQICLVWVLPALISSGIHVQESWNCVPELSEAIITVCSGIDLVCFTLCGQSVLVVYKSHQFVHTSFQCV